MSPGYGYTGIVIAMPAGLHPLAMVAANIGVPTYLAHGVVASALLALLALLAVLAVLAASMLTRYRLRRGPRQAASRPCWTPCSACPSGWRCCAWPRR